MTQWLCAARQQQGTGPSLLLSLCVPLGICPAKQGRLVIIWALGTNGPQPGASRFGDVLPAPEVPSNPEVPTGLA